MLNLSIFSERLAEFMQEKDLNQSTLAQALHTSRPKIGLYLRAEHAPTYANFIALLSYFGCSADYLLGLTDQTPAVSYREIRPFGSQLRNLLRERSLTIYAFQKKTNFSWSMIYKWLNGTAEPSLYNLVKTAETLDLSVDELLGRI